MILESTDVSRWPIEHFPISEIKENSQYGTFVLTEALLKTLRAWDEIRDYVNKPIIITDACRFDGSETSQHFFKQFNAIDGWCEGYTSEELMEVAEKLDLGIGRGLYPHNRGFIHLDYGPSRKQITRWYRDKDGEYHTVDSFDDFLK